MSLTNWISHLFEPNRVPFEKPRRLKKRKPRARLAVEMLEDRVTPTINVFVDAVTGNVTIMDAVDPVAGDNIEEANFVTLDNDGGDIRVIDPSGAIAGPGATQVNATTVDIAPTAQVDIDLQGGDDFIDVQDGFLSLATITDVIIAFGAPSNSDQLEFDMTDETYGIIVHPDDTEDGNVDINIDVGNDGGGTDVAFDVVGMELLYFDGNESVDDDLIVELGDGDDGVTTATVQRGAIDDSDVVISSSLPDIFFEDFDEFTLVGSDATTATFLTHDLDNAQVYLYDGTAHHDTLIIEGGNAFGDVYLVSLDGGGDVQVSDFTSGVTINTVGLQGNFDHLQIDSLGGQDTFTVDHVPNVLMTFNGGGPIGELQQPVGDVLNLTTNGNSFSFLPGPETDSGTVSITGGRTVTFDEFELLRIDNANFILPDRFDDPDLIFPGNDNIPNATVLGSEPNVTLLGLTLHDQGAGVINEDYFKITAHDTGKLIVNAFFTHDLGNIDIEILDASGDQVAIATSTDNNEQLIIPVVAQEMYFLHVFSANNAPNIYNLEIENFAAPVPTAVHLDPASDTGMFNNDNLTNDPTPRFIVQADLQDFADMGIPILDGEQANAGDVPGAAVEVHIISSTTGVDVIGFADPIGVSNILFEFTPAAPLAGDIYFVSAAVRIFDGQTPTEDGRTQLSEPLWVTIDTTDPKGMVLETFTADLTGDQEVPPVNTLAGGGAKLTLNPARDQLQMVIELAGLDLGAILTPGDTTDDLTPNFADDNVTMMHIHNAAAGANGPIVFNILTDPDVIIDVASSRVSTVWDATEGLNAAQLANLVNELLYINVHTVANGTGEVRGQILPSGGTLRLLESSDTGMSIIDGVTSKMLPAFVVKGEANAKVRIFARNTLTGVVNLVGSGVIGSDGTDGVANNGFGLGEITVEPLADGTYEIFAEFEDLAGNISRHYDFQFPGAPAVIVGNATTDFLMDVQHLFGNIQDLDVKLDIAHVDVSQLEIFLISPNGTQVELVTNVAGGGANFTGTTFDDEAAVSINAGVAPYTGRFQPEGMLADLDGEDPNGTWTLRITTPDDPGELLSWRLCIHPDAGLPIEIDTVAPNTAFLDLVEASDTGRHNDDNVTRDNIPDVTITTEDPNSHFHTLFTDNLKFRIFDRFEGAEEFLLYDSAKDGAVDAVNTIGDMYTALQFVLETLPDQFATLIGTNTAVINGTDVLAGIPGVVLADGIHNLKLEVEDRAGNISHDFLNNVLIDTVAPPVTIIGIDPGATDTGVPGPGNQETFNDRITSDTGTGFVGRAEADAIVRLFADAVNNGMIDGTAFSLTVAEPFDGDDAEPNGQWHTNYLYDLNNPLAPDFFPLDGLREIIAEAEDLAGNINTVTDDIGNAEQQLEIFIDTQGPQVFDPVGPAQAIQVITAGMANTNFNIFNIKGPNGQNQGPTPLVDGLLINVRDLPLRVAEFLYVALQEGDNDHPAENPGNYMVVGDHVGNVAITSIEVINAAPVAGQQATATIQINFAEPLPDDRYTLTIKDEVVDPAGNNFDGESNAIGPNDPPTLPSGDGQPGGNFVARFTVDSRAEIGQWEENRVQVDINGNGVWDPENTGDQTNDDLGFNFGLFTDYKFAGDFALAGAATSSGFDKLGAYGRTGGVFRFLLDVNHDGVADLSLQSLPINGIPVAGDFAPNHPGDEVGLFDGTTWWLDTGGNNTIDAGDATVRNGQRGHPIVGDFDGDGRDDLGTYQPDTDLFQFDLSYNGFNGVDLAFVYGFPSVQERPVAADMNGDGVDDIGLWVPGTFNPENDVPTQWYWLVSNGPTPRAISAAPPFQTDPFGNDLFFNFGHSQGVPIVGNFDPPSNNTGQDTSGTPAQVAIVQQAGTMDNVAVEGQLNVTRGSAGLVLRYVDEGTMYWGGLTNSGGTVKAEIWVASGGRWTRLASKRFPALHGEVRFEAVGPNLRLYVNGNLFTQATNEQLVEGYVGTYTSGGATLNDFTYNVIAFEDVAASFGFHGNGNWYQDYYGESEKWFQDNTGAWYFITPDGALRKWNGLDFNGSPVIANLDTSFYDNPTLLFAVPVHTTVNDVTQNYWFQAGSSDYLNYYGENEKWFQDESGAWYFITPDGTVRQWDGRSFAGSSLIALLDASVYDDVTVLYTDPATVTVPQLRQQFAFYSTGETYFSYYGQGELWFQGEKGAWFFITPDGVVRKWNGSNFAGSLIIAIFDNTVYNDLDQLF